MNRLQVLSEVQNKSEISCYDFDRRCQNCQRTFLNGKLFGGFRCIFMVREHRYINTQFFIYLLPHYRPCHLPKIIGQKDKSNHLGDSVRTTNKKLDYVYLHLCCVAADTLFTVNCCWQVRPSLKRKSF